MLDTSALIDELGPLPGEVDKLGVSVVTIGELYFGALRGGLAGAERANRVERLERVRATYAEITIDAAVAASWGRLAAALRDAGAAMRVNDLWIAATALVHDAAVVTRDRDYEAVREVAASELRVIAIS